MSSKPKNKFYVVYDSWAQCDAAVRGVAGAKFQGFPTRGEAEQAFSDGAELHWGSKAKEKKPKKPAKLNVGEPITNALCVDAAWNAVTKDMEYRGVWHHNGQLAFHQGPYPNGTNNIGEYLAIIHALAILTKHEIDWPIYTDSRTAISWVRRGKANSASIKKGETGPKINELVERADRWLATNSFSNKILKWETDVWGEIPADFGRK